MEVSKEIARKEALGFFHEKRKEEIERAEKAVWEIVCQENLSLMQTEKLIAMLSTRIKEVITGDVWFIRHINTFFLYSSTLGNSQSLKTLHFQSIPFFLHLHFSVGFLYVFLFFQKIFKYLLTNLPVCAAAITD